jgi:hypothetical protein
VRVIPAGAGIAGLADFYMVPPAELSLLNLFLLLQTTVGPDFVNSEHGMQFLPEGLARG